MPNLRVGLPCYRDVLVDDAAFAQAEKEVATLTISPMQLKYLIEGSDLLHIDIVGLDRRSGTGVVTTRPRPGVKFA